MTEFGDKKELTRRRAERIESLSTQLSPQDRVHVQGELSLINAQIKAINTAAAAKLKADADRRKVVGLAEAQANAARARANTGLRPAPDTAPDQQHHYRDDRACPACGTDSSVGCVVGSDEDDDPGQTSAIDSWVDSVLLRHDVDFARAAKGHVRVLNDSGPHSGAAIELLVKGIYAAARGQELPDLPAPAKTAVKMVKKAKAKEAKAAKPKSANGSRPG